MPVIIMCLLIHFGVLNANPPADWDIRAKLSPLQLEKSDITAFMKGQNAPEYSIPEPGTTANDCLVKLNECENESGICKVDLEIFKQFCGDWKDERSLQGCDKRYVKECRSALRTVNLGRPNLSHCACDGHASRSIEDLSKCNLLRKNLISHPCTHDPPLYQKFTHDNFSPSAEKLTYIPSVNHDNVQLKQEENILQNRNDLLSTIVNGLSTSANENLPRKFDETPNNSKIINISGTEHRNNNAVHGRSEASNDILFPFAIKLPNCLNLLDRCIKNLSCAKSLNQVRALCTARSCEKFRDQCLWAYEEFQKYETYHSCTCLTETNALRRQRCLDYEHSVSSNQCIGSTNRSLVNSTVPSDSLSAVRAIPWVKPVSENDNLLLNKKLPKLGNAQWKPIQNVGTNCFDVYLWCTREPRCLSHYLRLVKFCGIPNHGRQACYHNSQSCIEELMEFYSHQSHITHVALECYCEENDYDCEVQRSIFRPTCLSTDHSPDQLCSTLWNKCTLQSSCVNTIRKFLNTCLANDESCHKNQENCTTIFHKIFLIFQRFNCECPDDLLFSSDNYTFRLTCRTFQAIIQSPLCIRPSESGQKMEMPTNGRRAACVLSQRLELSPTSNIRIYPNWPMYSSNKNRPSCSQICTCSTGCLHQFCSIYPGRIFVDDLHGTTFIKEKDIRREWDYFPSFNRSYCMYIPTIDKSCGCQSHNVITCAIPAPNGTRKVSHYSLALNFDSEELLTILRLTNEGILNRERLYYTQLFKFGELLKNLLNPATFYPHCNLDLHKIVFDNQPYPKAALVQQRNVNRLKREKPVPTSELHYILTVTTEPDTSTHNLDLNVPDCLLQLRLIILMINHQYPRVRHHSLLSILKSATLVTQAGLMPSVEFSHAKQQRKLPEETNPPLTDQSTTWRHPRTSADKKFRLSINGQRKPFFSSRIISLFGLTTCLHSSYSFAD